MKTLIACLVSLCCFSVCEAQYPYYYVASNPYPQLPVYRPVYPLAWGVVVPVPVYYPVMPQPQPVIVVPPANVTISNNYWVPSQPNRYRSILNGPRY